MKKFAVLVVLLLMVGVQVAWQQKEKRLSPAEASRKYIVQELKVAINLIDSALGASKNEKTQRIRYPQVRKHYKRVEFFVEYYSPREAKFFINGPPIPKHD